MHNASLNARLWFVWVNSPVPIRNEMLVFVFELRIYSFLRNFFLNKILFNKKNPGRVSERLSPFWHACILVSYCVDGVKFSRRMDWWWPAEKIRGATLPALSKTLYSTGILGVRIPLKRERIKTCMSVWSTNVPLFFFFKCSSFKKNVCFKF